MLPETPVPLRQPTNSVMTPEIGAILNYIETALIGIIFFGIAYLFVKHNLYSVIE